MTDHNNDSSTGLPTFEVNVSPTHKITADHLNALLTRFRRGQIEPLIFGDRHRPEAAIIPFSAFMQLIRQDHKAVQADEQAFQDELSRRIETLDRARSHGEEAGLRIDSDEDLYRWAEGLGETGRSWAEAQRAADRGPSDE